MGLEGSEQVNLGSGRICTGVREVEQAWKDLNR